MFHLKKSLFFSRISLYKSGFLVIVLEIMHGFKFSASDLL